MKYIKNKIFPIGDYYAVTIYPFVFYKRDMNATDRNHENIHGEQQKELFLIGFYVVWLFEYFFKGYNNISFEKEAFDREGDLSYLKTRKSFAMWNVKYLDKILHVIFSFVIVFCLEFFTPVLLACILAYLVGFSKEIIDWYSYGNFSKNDLLADCVGILIYVFLCF